MFNLREVRMALGLTQREMAKLLHLSTSAVGMMEQGRRRVTEQTQQQLGELIRQSNLEERIKQTNPRHRINRVLRAIRGSSIKSR